MIYNRYKFFTVLLLVSALQGVLANEIPHAYRVDKRNAWVRYVPNNVITLTLPFNDTVTVYLSPNEVIDTDHIHTSASKVLMLNKANFSGNSFSLSVVDDSVPAELTFQTNLHRYTFVIQGDAKAKPLFSVTVKYPNHVAKTAYAGFIKTATGKKLNQLYWSSGDTQLQPTAVWDDGYFTYFTFSENTPIPAIYSVYNALGEEQLEESKMVKGGRVLEVRTLARQFTLRLGDEWLAIFNQGYQNR